MKDKEELVWVSAEFAEKLKVYEAEENKRALQLEELESYMETVTTDSKNDFRVSLESLEEDVAIYKGLMVSVKQAFEKAKNEQLAASYELWQKFEDDLPGVQKKIDSFVEKLTPLADKLNILNSLLNNINTYDIDKIGESIEHLSGLYGKNKEMVEFLVNNFKAEGRE